MCSVIWPCCVLMGRIWSWASNVNGAWWLDHCDVIASISDAPSGTTMLTRQNKTHLQQRIEIEYKPTIRQTWNEEISIKPIMSVLCSYFKAILAIAVISIRWGWQCSVNFHEQDGRDAGYAACLLAWLHKQRPGNTSHYPLINDLEFLEALLGAVQS